MKSMFYMGGKVYNVILSAFIFAESSLGFVYDYSSLDVLIQVINHNLLRQGTRDVSQENWSVAFSNEWNVISSIQQNCHKNFQK